MSELKLRPPKLRLRGAVCRAELATSAKEPAGCRRYQEPGVRFVVASEWLDVSRGARGHGMPCPY
jgi:hypothetical protein